VCCFVLLRDTCLLEIGLSRVSFHEDVREIGKVSMPWVVGLQHLLACVALETSFGLQPPELFFVRPCNLCCLLCVWSVPVQWPQKTIQAKAPELFQS
jgi:hypothetical protein